jgi:hypothetical protein
MPTTESAIIAEARRVARLQRKITALNRQLTEAKSELRTAKKNLKALASGTQDPFNQTPPMRVFGEEP